jgi:hypothetical protein
VTSVDKLQEVTLIEAYVLPQEEELCNVAVPILLFRSF